MASSVLSIHDPIAERGLAFFEELLRDFHPRNSAVRLWDGSRLDAEAGQFPRCTLVINHPGAIRRMLSPSNQAALGEAYVYGDVEIEGDVEALFPLAPFLLNHKLSLARQIRLGTLLLGIPKARMKRVGRAGVKLGGRRIPGNVIGRLSLITTMSPMTSSDYFSTNEWCIRVHISSRPTPA